jgi:hypothetical protein
MHRRVWIKQITIAGGAIFLLPACRYDKGAISLTLKTIDINDREEKLLAEIADAIIPETGTYGAKTLNLHQFLLKMIDDCYDNKQQDKYLNGLRQLNDYSKEKTGNLFTELEQNNKLILIRCIVKEKANEDLNYFLAETRHWVVKGYETSEYFMTKIIPYELVPGRFHGCVKVFPAF